MKKITFFVFTCLLMFSFSMKANILHGNTITFQGVLGSWNKTHTIIDSDTVLLSFKRSEKLYSFISKLTCWNNPFKIDFLNKSSILVSEDSNVEYKNNIDKTQLSYGFMIINLNSVLYMENIKKLNNINKDKNTNLGLHLIQKNMFLSVKQNKN